MTLAEGFVTDRRAPRCAATAHPSAPIPVSAVASAAALRARTRPPAGRPDPGSSAEILHELAGRLAPLAEARPDDVAAALARARRSRGRTATGAWTLAFLNAHAFNLCAEDRGAHAAFASADLLLRDGVGAAILLRRLGLPEGANANGTDLVPRMACAPGARVAIYGGAPGVAEAAAEALRMRGAKVVAARHGFHPLALYSDFIAYDTAPRELGGGGATLVVLGMGAPRQEVLASRLRAAAAGPAGIVCAGGLLDFLAGRVPRAPRRMRRAGLEWLFRLAMEPRRLFRRYMIGNPLFLWRAEAAARLVRRSQSRFRA